MYNPNNAKEIVFPLTFGIISWPGKQYIWNDVNGGAKPIGAFGYTTNQFLGGRCIKLGFMPELGFYGCQDKNHQEGTSKLIGFHVEDPSVITEYGKSMIEQMFPNNTIRYERYESIKKVPVDPAIKAKAIEEARKIGVPEQALKVSHVDTLVDLVKVAKFEKAMEEAQEKKPVDVANELLKKTVKPRRKPAVKATV